MLLHSALLALPSLVLCVLLALQSLVSEPHEFLVRWGVTELNWDQWHHRGCPERFCTYWTYTWCIKQLPTAVLLITNAQLTCTCFHTNARTRNAGHVTCFAECCPDTSLTAPRTRIQLEQAHFKAHVWHFYIWASCRHDGLASCHGRTNNSKPFTQGVFISRRSMAFLMHTYVLVEPSVSRGGGQYCTPTAALLIRLSCLCARAPVCHTQQKGAELRQPCFLGDVPPPEIWETSSADNLTTPTDLRSRNTGPGGSCAFG